MKRVIVRSMVGLAVLSFATGGFMVGCESKTETKAPANTPKPAEKAPETPADPPAAPK